MGSSSSTSSTRGVTSEEWAVHFLLVAPFVLLRKSGSSSFTSSTRHVNSKEWAVPPPLVEPVVLLLKRDQFLLH
jgi:hypothetical protein